MNPIAGMVRLHRFADVRERCWRQCLQELGEHLQWRSLLVNDVSQKLR